MSALALQNTTLTLLPKVDKRIDDIQYANYSIPTLKHGHKLRVAVDSGVGELAEYVDVRKERQYSIPSVTFQQIQDVKQVARLAKLNALLKQLVNDKTATVAQMKSALTNEQYVTYVECLNSEQDTSEINYGNGMPSELTAYNERLKAADFEYARFERMSSLKSIGKAKYKPETIKKSYNKSEDLYEKALERLEEIWSVATPAELYELQNWMDREIDFDRGADKKIGIDAVSVPRVRGSKSPNALDSGLPKLSKRLKRKECQLVALRAAAFEIAFETEKIEDEITQPSTKLRDLLAGVNNEDDLF